MLGTQPYLRFGMIALEQRHLFLREREEAFERQIARITALDTPMVDRRQTFENIFPETQFGGLAALRFEIGTVVVSHDPDIETIGLGDTDIVSRNMAQHLDAVHPEKRQFADILFEVLPWPMLHRETWPAAKDAVHAPGPHTGESMKPLSPQVGRMLPLRSSQLRSRRPTPYSTPRGSFPATTTHLPSSATSSL